MTALSALRQKSQTENPGFELELDGGVTVTLRSVMNLEDEELTQFAASQKKLGGLDEGDDYLAIKAEMVSLLAGVSTNKKATAEALDRESFGTLALLFREYGSVSADAGKSQGDS